MVEMKSTDRGRPQKGEAKLVSILVWASIAFGILFSVEYFQNRNNGIMVQPPKVEAR